LILDIFRKIQTIIISFTFITLIIRIFKNFRSIRSILRVANYVILALFGISFYDAFGFNILTSINAYFNTIISLLKDSHFYEFLMRIFNSKEIMNQESIRESYKKQLELDD
jgi:sugar (pentulose or hexulose) kinase